MSYSLSLFTNAYNLTDTVGAVTQLSKAQADNGSYTGDATTFYRLDIPREVYKASAMPKHKFKTTVVKLVENRYKINIKTTARYINKSGDNTPDKFHITLYEVNSYWSTDCSWCCYYGKWHYRINVRKY